ncbi:DUF805 domain-containing protein [Candidatus Lucifugimonas marina]|uniref:DUF805 domain-containing protein n=1 Tax=Candidatus Lucifugimonas marina TaxID=3038979 RepID=A0AAJ5ZBV7_9CHLR|nr:DUF805 domain-containing protein [SAR202 cluster bacterium JH702]MDG0869788.1 DUF805 domain-containing protein [SAR202 cluster bacterium JH639]WFG34514.1 DUF805 domain-containing protein [SAR202 cluster bacterium JH545]WFG38443.1 DUF805 domain-containing protein [SAR202 cluster bacterium JH1073]
MYTFDMYMVLAANMLISTSACIRRLHDFNQPAIYGLLVLIPIVGWLIELLLIFMPGNPRTNRYGDPPKGLRLGFPRSIGPGMKSHET